MCVSIVSTSGRARLLATSFASVLVSAAWGARADEPSAPPPAQPTGQEMVVVPPVVAPAAAPSPATPREPASGFATDVRLSMDLANGRLGAGILPPLAIGYRAPSWAVLVGPYFTRQRWTSGQIGPGGDTFAWSPEMTTTSYGATALGELRVLTTHDRSTTLHALVGAMLAGAVLHIDDSGEPPGAMVPSVQGFSGEVTYGGAFGLGIRHWVTPHLALGAELTESYENHPSGAAAIVSTQPDGQRTVVGTRNLRSSLMTTAGTLGVSFVL